MLFAQLNRKYRGRISYSIQISKYFSKNYKIQAFVIQQYRAQISLFWYHVKLLVKDCIKKSTFKKLSLEKKKGFLTKGRTYDL